MQWGNQWKVPRTHSTLAEIAAAENISESYLGRVLRLTLLAPDIVEALLNAHEPLSLAVRTAISTSVACPTWCLRAHNLKVTGSNPVPAPAPDLPKECSRGALKEAFLAESGVWAPLASRR